MRKTCFVCYGNDGKSNTLTYHELSTKVSGEEFFVFMSPANQSHEVSLRELYRGAVSTSRLGHPISFFKNILKVSANTLGTIKDGHSILSESLILLVLRRGAEVFVFHNKKSVAIHFDAGSGTEGTTAGWTDIGLIYGGRQGDLFQKRIEDYFVLERFTLDSGNHTILFTPSRDFVKRYREVFLDSVFFPSFDVPDSGEIKLDTDLTFPGIHWELHSEQTHPQPIKKRGIEMIKSSIPMAVGAVALVLAIILIFKPFGGESPEESSEGGILLSAEEEFTDKDYEEESEEAPTTSAGTGNSGTGRDKTENTTEIPNISLAEGWKKKFGGPVTSSPSVCNGNVVFGCRDGNMYCFSADGVLKWKYGTLEGIGASPECFKDLIIGADYAGDIFCLSMTDGKQLWEYRAGAKIVSSPITDGEYVIACTMDGRIIAAEIKTGKVAWSQKIGEAIWATPTLTDKYIMVSTTDGSLIRLTRDGKIVWRVAPGGSIHSSPLCIADENLVVVGTGDKYVFGYSISDGSLMWRFAAGSEVRSSPVSDGETVYVGTEDGLLLALDLKGSQRWRRDMGGPVRSRPLILDDMILVTSYNSRLSILSASDGKLIEEYSTESQLYSSPAHFNNRIFFGSMAGFIHAPLIVRSGG